MSFSPTRLVAGSALVLAIAAGGLNGISNVHASKPAASKCVADPKDGKGGPYPSKMSADCTSLKAINVNIMSDAKYPGAFAPDNITIKAGTKVTWMWKALPHNVYPFCGGALKESGKINQAPCSAQLGYTPGKNYSYTFSQKGTFTYRCFIHAGMNGEVIVK